jgi:hypothetical protein
MLLTNEKVLPQNLRHFSSDLKKLWNSEILDFEIGHFLTNFFGKFSFVLCPYW